MTREDIALAIVNAGLTYSAEQQPVFMRECTLDNVVDIIVSLMESGE